MRRTLIRDLFLRLLGLIFLAAFLSLLAQIDVLFGSRGLLPAASFFDAVRASGAQWQVASLFLVDAGDAALHAGALVGVGLSLLLVAGIAPRYCLVALWLLYLSFVQAGQDFFSFQWDNLLLETAFFSIFVAPPGLRRRPPPPPHPAAVFLMLWLLFRLHVESGAAKLLSGDPTWRDLTAMVDYYQTAPLPTWIGWYAHQMPLLGHRLTALFTLVVELLLPFLLWAPHRLRGYVFAVLVSLQIGVALTANYAFFNDLTLALCLFVLDDDHIAWLFPWRRSATRAQTAPVRRRGDVLAWGAAALVAALSLVPFSPWVGLPTAADRAVAPMRRFLANWRTLNAYHLFAQMKLIRREAVIEASSDGREWQAYDFRYKPGDLDRAPRFVAPHQPRVDFQMWFLLLRGGAVPPYFDALLDRILDGSHAVDPLFRRNPFPDEPPRFVRVAVYRYRFTDADERRASGDWWQREFLGTTAPRSRP